MILRNKITWTEFSTAVANNTDLEGHRYPPPSQEQYQGFINGLARWTITSKREAAMILAHCIMESTGLQFKREIVCNPDPGFSKGMCCDKYTGCKPPLHYYGRGYIQLTGVAEYAAATDGLRRYGRGTTDLVKSPNLLATDDTISWDCAFWFWMDRVRRGGPTPVDFDLTVSEIIGPEPPESPWRRRRHEYYENIVRDFHIY